MQNIPDEQPQQAAANSVFDEVMDSEVMSGVQAVSAGIAKKENYDRLMSFSNVRTYSMTQVFHECPRKFKLMKMEADCNERIRYNNPTFAYGHAVGAGVAVYDKTKDMQAALWAAFLAWDVDFLEVELNARGAETGKSFVGAMRALLQYPAFLAEETDLNDYDFVQEEATFLVDLEDGHYVSMHADEIFRHRTTGKFLVKENKTKGTVSTVDPAEYANSEQATSYSIPVDLLGGQDYKVLYTIYLAAENRWVAFEFAKPPLSKIEWLQDQWFITRQLEDYMQSDFFPKRGGSCMNFNRRCQYFDTCGMNSQKRFGKRFDELDHADVPTLQQVEFYHHVVNASDVVERQKEIIRGE